MYVYQKPALARYCETRQNEKSIKEATVIRALHIIIERQTHKGYHLRKHLPDGSGTFAEFHQAPSGLVKCVCVSGCSVGCGRAGRV